MSESMNEAAAPQVFGLSNLGLVRPRNEDRYLIKGAPDGGLLLAVIDGMGGQPAGELAAELARRQLAAMVVESAGPAQLSQCLAEINASLAAEEERRPEHYGLGCTVTAVLIRAGRASWIHVGDCRLWLFRAGRLQQITIDHNMAQYLHAEGKLSEAELLTSPLRNLLDQACGGSFLAADSGAFSLAPGDLLLLSSDGLHGELGPREIAAILQQGQGIEATAQALVAAALQAGGKDNITTVLLKW